MTPLIIQLFCEENLENVQEVGNKLFAKCPYCGKAYKHFNVDLKTGLFYCYRCGATGNFYQLVKYITGNYPNLDKMEEEYTSELSLQELQNIFQPVQEISNIQKGCVNWTENTVGIGVKGRLPRQAREYLLNRNVSVELADELQFRVGVTGRYIGRIIMPVIQDNEVQNFVARSFTNNQKRYDGPHKWENYVNKSELLWGLENIKYNSEIVVTEGIFDAIALMSRYPTVALLGKSMSDAQTEKLLNKAKSCIILLDAEFLRSAKKIAEKLLGFIPVKIAIMEEGDPSSHFNLAIKAIQNAKNYYEL